MRLLRAVVLIGATGCLSPWDEAWSVQTDAVVPEVLVSESIGEDTTWSSDRTYVLARDTLVYVEGDAVLTIDPGVVVRGERGSALIVSRDAEIDARGEPDAPIVFTSNQPQGQRRPGDWGGLVLLGNDWLNKTAPRQIEGIAGDEPRAQYGGEDPFDSCGALQYVRVEFAGFELTDGVDGNELNGLTLGGCGRNTFVRNVQIHRGLDDGIELFGGSVDLKFIVVSGAGDDSLDWDEGWNGRVQFGVVQQLPRHWDPAVEKNGDEGIEGDGAFTGEDLDEDGYDDVALPLSNPVLCNLTVLGSGDPETAQNAAHLKEGTAATLVNMLVARQTGHGVDVEDVQTSLWTQPKAEAALVLRDSLFHDVGAGSDWAAADVEDDDGAFDELAWIEQGEGNQLGADPELAPLDEDGQWVVDPRGHWTPAAGSAAENGGAPPEDEFFDASATYNGAVRPGSASAWWDGWTAFALE
ncbi:MAG: hypothetical protein KTR31_29000 [Myxococcales bacterium]|nr:hypothetical protein [Myxococcales bacterium]